MKNLLIVLLVVAVVCGIATFVVFTLGSSAQRAADRALNRLEPQESFAGRFPAVARKNETAVELEQLAAALQVDVRPRQETLRAKRVDLDPAVARSMSDWLNRQHERGNDRIDPLPQDLRRWLAGNGPAIDAMAQQLASNDQPRWPVVLSGPAAARPIPNLLGHMRLFRVLCLASLDAESRGDAQRAWTLQQAAWNLAAGLQQRPELICHLVSTAGFRLMAGTMRKLQPPLPEWAVPADKLRLRDGIVDAARYELATMRAAADSGSLMQQLAGADGGESLVSRAEEALMAPVERWVAADIAQATAGELASLKAADPCSAETAGAAARIQSNVSPLARHFAGMMTAGLPGALARAAQAEIAMEGTVHILRIKAARAASGHWPASLPAAPSVCRSAQWLYAIDDAGQPVVRFTGTVPPLPQTILTRIPTTYVISSREEGEGSRSTSSPGAGK